MNAAGPASPRITPKLKAITSFTIPAEADANAERERRRSVFGRWLIHLMVGLVVLWVVVEFGFRQRHPDGFGVVMILFASILPGILVGWLVAKGERPDQLRASDAIRADLVDDPAQFGAEEAELLTRIRRAHIRWMAVKFAFGTGCLFVATMQAGSSNSTTIDTLTAFFLFVAAGAYIGTMWARGWMSIGNYRG